ncbi:MAG: CapA family protein [Ignavibacteriae bacterium]|nr:CapA family protein [Ignavibacteriota bacterium]
MAVIETGSTAPANSGARRSAHADDSSNAIVMRFGGDCLLSEHYERACGEDVSLAFHNFDLFRTADIGMVNLECPVTTRGTKVEKPFNFRMHGRFLDVIKEAGIDIVNLANNHIYDYGKVGLFDTITHLDSVGILHVGAGRNKKEAHRPVVIDERGKRIAFLGYYGGGEAPRATETKAGVARRELKLIKADLSRLKRKDSVDYVVVNLHWGIEKATHPDQEQIKFARTLIDSGADAVIGHHPHVLQGIERYKHGVIAYSLGNLIFGGNSRSSYDTGIFEIRLGSDSTEYDLIPVRIKDWNASVLTGAAADSVVQNVRDLSRGFPKSIFKEKK